MKLTEKEVLQLMEYTGAGPNDLVPRGYAATVEVFSHVANAAYTLGIDRANAAQPTLRDRFAGQAMQGFAADPRMGHISSTQIAETAYRWANAMMKERNK